MRNKLQQLADNKIRLVQEQIQLEDKQKDLFGLRVPENSFKKDVENATSLYGKLKYKIGCINKRLKMVKIINAFLPKLLLTTFKTYLITNK